MSFVSVPAVPDALVTERARRDRASRDGMAQHRERAARFEREALARRFARDLGVPFDAPPKRRPMNMEAHRRMARLFEREIAAERRRGR